MELLRILEECQAQGGGDCALATVMSTQGPAYRRAGARLLIRRDQRRWGAISGGCLESDLVQHGLAVLEHGMPKLVHYAPEDDGLVFGLGTGCGGTINVLVEPLPDPERRELHARLAAAGPLDALIASPLGTYIGPAGEAPEGALVQPIVPALTLFLFGASPAAEPLARLAEELGWHVRLADQRASARNLAAKVEEILIAPADGWANHFSYPSPSAAVVMTHHFERDLVLIRQLASKGLDYLGLVGARERAARLLAESGLPEDLRSRIHAPAGLDLGADTPAEIALSIAAEIQAVQRKASAVPLKNRTGAIHAEDRHAIAILAAGGSRRMGRPKQLIRIGGQSLVRRSAETALGAGGGPVYVVVGHEAAAVRAELRGLNVETIENPGWKEGLASSLRAAIERCQPSAETLRVMLCDQPGVSDSLLRDLQRGYQVWKSLVVACQYPDGPGVPALFHASLFPALRGLRGDEGAKRLIRQFDGEVMTIPFVETGDVDTSEDVAKLAKPMNER